MSNYSEYFETRKPAAFSEKFLIWWHERMLKLALKFIPDLHKKRLLEIGAAHGFFAKACKKNQITYSGHEMNVEQASLLKKSGFDVTPAMIPPIPQGKPAQVIWMSHVLEHATTFAEARQMLLACHERLDENGYVVIIAPDIYHWKEEFWSLDWSHGFPTSIPRVQQLLHEAGFSVTKTMHHTMGVSNPFLAWLFSHTFRLFLPFNLINMISKKLNGRTFGYSFMSVFGWRQIYLIGHKN
jgi:hypothetical protein